MIQRRPAHPASTRLPTEPISRLTKPFVRFLHIETASGAILLLGTIAALVLANSPWNLPLVHFWDTPIGIRVGAFESSRSLREWINGGLMTLFFFIVTLELKRELVLGELTHPRVAALSIAGALGGMLAPASVYLMLQFGQPGEHGWGTVMSTDTAFLVSCLALLGTRLPHALYVFLLSLVVVDDIGAVLVVAIGYSDGLVWQALALGVLGIAVVRGLAMLGIRSVAVYFLASGLIWLAIDASGIHATITGVIMGLLTPSQPWVSDKLMHAILRRVATYPLGGSHWTDNTADRQALHTAEIAARETLSPVERLETALHPWVSFGIIPLFAFANAGVPISFAGFGDPVCVAVVAGFVLGKPLGIVGFSWLAVRLGIASLPTDISWSMLCAGGLLAGIGFTMAIFIAGLAFDATMFNAAKLGILSASIISAVTGLALLWWLCPRAAYPGLMHVDREHKTAVD
jgi:NhaA family Na+:H+ antiporter